MKTNTTVISTEECSEFFGSTSVTGDHLCTTGADGHGVCGVIIEITLISGNVFCLQEDLKNGIIGTGTRKPGRDAILSQLTAIDYYNRGLSKGNSEDYQGAIADYNQAIKLQPDDATAYNNRGLAKSESGDIKGAIAD